MKRDEMHTRANPGGSHFVVRYDTALGFQVTSEFERFFLPNASADIGAKMYFVKYKASSATDNGTSIPVDALSSQMNNFDGCGLDLTIGICRYF